MEFQVRKPTRLNLYNYSEPGMYFITVCTHKHEELLSDIVGAIHESPENRLTDCGVIVKNTIEKLAQRFDVEIDKYVIMPNHIHLIVNIPYNTRRAILESPLQCKRSVISNVIGYLKMNASKQIHSKYPKKKIWQRSFHDHIIRNENDYLEIWKYIDTNVMNWDKDCFHNNKTGV